MSSVLLKMLPFVLGSIAPTTIGMVVIFLTSTTGVVKACMFILGNFIFYVLWGLISLYLVSQISSASLDGSSIVSATVFLIGGLLLIILAVRSFLGEDDPDAPPPKFMSILDKLGPVKLFGLGIAISIVKPRFIIFVLEGASIIAEARLQPIESFISLLILALLMVWPMLIPLIVFLIMGEHRSDALKSMRAWLVRNQRMINVTVMGILGIFMVFLGLTRIF
ncbi:MAG: GAP family protein [Ktedonobacteraceae bacterium]|nr:GAP family protein [Ktedonobacteraceae bacterium]